MEASRDADGEVAFTTGDPYIDKWERELAMGLEPDLLEDLPSWHRRGTKSLGAKEAEEEAAKATEAEFSDDYSQLITE